MPLSQLRCLMAPDSQQDKVETPYPSLKTLYDLALFTSPILFLAAALSYTHAEPLSYSAEPCSSCIWAFCQPGTSSSSPSTGELHLSFRTQLKCCFFLEAFLNSVQNPCPCKVLPQHPVPPPSLPSSRSDANPCLMSLPH